MAKRSASVSPKNQRVHVISRKDGWAVKKEGNTKASKVFDRKEAAVEGARKISKGHDVIVHNKDGSIQRWERSESNS
ncbi:MAG: DUF2188 domain-containing protein [Syntrophobacteraceae bacterium]|jgi:hypothetical protein